MSLVDQRSLLCKAFFEDFVNEQRDIECAVCLMSSPPVHCLGGSHPRCSAGEELIWFSFSDFVNRNITTRSQAPCVVYSFSFLASSFETQLYSLRSIIIAVYLPIVSSDDGRLLVSLTVDEVIALFHNLGLLDDCEDVIRRRCINGAALNKLISISEVTKLSLPLS